MNSCGRSASGSGCGPLPLLLPPLPTVAIATHNRHLQETRRDRSRMTATDSVLSPEPSGQRFSTWLESAPIGRTAARELMAGLGIEPGRVRLPGISAAVAWLTPEQQSTMDQAAARVAAGQSVAQVVADGGGPAGGDTGPPATTRDRLQPVADAGQLAALAAAIVGALEARRDPSQTVAALPAAGPPEPSPLARAAALQQAAREGLMLTSAELAQITGLPVGQLDGLKGGARLQGYRLRKIKGSTADPAPLWQLLPPTAATARD